MSTFFPLPVQVQPFALNGAGVVIGDTTVRLKSFLLIDGITPITMAMFGSKGFGTLEPGNNTLEEQISFTGITQNADGTATLTGVSSVEFVTPFTETSGLNKTHAGSTSFVISNDAGFYNAIKGYIDTAVSAGAVPATTLVNGIGHVSVNPIDAANPIFVGNNDTRVPAYAADTGTANTYAITVSPSISAYTNGQIFSFKAGNANSGASTLNVDSVGAKTIKKNGGTANLVSGDIVAGQVCIVEYDGTNFQILSLLGTTAVTKFGGTGSDGALSIASGATNIDLGSALLVVKNYTSISITGTGSLTFSNPHANGTIIILKSQGNVTLTSSTAPMIDVSGMGASGGAGSTTTAPGSAGSIGQSSIDASLPGGTGGAGSGSPAAGGGNALQTLITFFFKFYKIACGSGGGGGGGTGLPSGGTGGRGGGGLVIECGGAWNFTTASGISVAGKNGTAGSGSDESGGAGGGGGGIFLAIYNLLTANSGTITVSGGTGGLGNGGGPAGSVGQNGQSLVALNTEFS